MTRLLVVGLLVLAGAASAEDGWNTFTVGNAVVKSRDKKGTSVKEFWAETDLNADVYDIQSALVDADKLHEFMPYVKESRFIANVEPDGSQYAYVSLQLPAPLSPRDYIAKVRSPRMVGPDSQGTFENTWVATPNKIPQRHHMIRLQVNEGSWVITPVGPGKSHVVYKFAVDPAGMIPPALADMANKTAIPDTLKALEKEAQKRGAERKKHPPAAPTPDAGQP